MGHYIPGAYVSDFTAAEIEALLLDRKRRAAEPLICRCCGAPMVSPYHCEYCGTYFGHRDDMPDGILFSDNRPAEISYNAGYMLNGRFCP